MPFAFTHQNRQVVAEVPPHSRRAGRKGIIKHRTAAHLSTVTGWIMDPDDAVAARAIALTAWYPPSIGAWLAVPAGRVQPWASANLAPTHPTGADPRIDPPLGDLAADGPELAADGPELVAVTAAVALAYRRADVPGSWRALLAEAAERDPIGNITGWDRALRGFVNLAPRRL
ncbi:hypothetical protein [Actinoplanes sp. G11-F43]|uniref:hypothetical protein n=1 Tax=Actinoplanes sp. G11-F43 TaxID=3424130 RepID=UPI003D33BF34